MCLSGNSAWQCLITHLLVFWRCPDPSIQPVIDCLRAGNGPGGLLIFLFIAQPWVSSLCRPRLGLPLWSPCLRGLQGEMKITHMNYTVKQVVLSLDFTLDIGEDYTNARISGRADRICGQVIPHASALTGLSYLLIQHCVSLTTAFSTSVNISVNIHQSAPPTHTQAQTSQESQTAFWLHIN